MNIAILLLCQSQNSGISVNLLPGPAPECCYSPWAHAREDVDLPVPQNSATRWILIAWIFVIASVAFLDRINISIAGQSLPASFI
jgi:hypothetical protein